jgi:hypothetical protein
MFRQQMDKYVCDQANNVEDDQHEESDKDQDQDDYINYPELKGFMVSDEINVNSISNSPQNVTLIFDSGASKTTLCDYNLLIDPKPITKAMNTYSGSINITHVGKLNIGRTLIYPAFYAPNGPRNLISATQLEDHGLKAVVKNRLILIRLGQKVIHRFPRVGNLYQSQGAKNNTTNYVMAISDFNPNLDYHILLGHPSDEYLSRFLKLHGISQANAMQRAKNCEVCIRCKLKRTPHSNPLPTTDRPFKTLHINVLQISPPSKSAMKYVLVIIDDFSRFNRIYLMKTVQKQNPVLRK